MLTVKIVRPDKSEFIDEAQTANYVPAKVSETGKSQFTYYTLSPSKEAVCVEVEAGTVYVMNSSGKTVGNYIVGSVAPNET